MSAPISTKPYLLRAMYEWCVDNGFTPYIAVKVQGEVFVPMEYVRNGEIVLNLSMDATKDLKMDNEAISFKTKFSGVARDIYVPVTAVAAIYAGENNQGMGFDVVPEPVEASPEKPTTPASTKPAISLAVTNKENASGPSEKEPKDGGKKPGLTIIK